MPVDLSRIPLFSGLSEEELDLLASHLNTRSFPKNTIVITEGDLSDSLYIVNEGQVKIYVSDDEGREMLLNILEPGDYFGELALIDKEPRSASAITMSSTKLSIISGPDFRETLKKHPELSIKLMSALVVRLREVTDTVRRLALLDVYGRVTTTLLSLARGDGDQKRVEPKLTQQDIANMVGASREMVSRIMKDLKTGGYIDTTKDAIVILKRLPSKW